MMGLPNPPPHPADRPDFGGILLAIVGQLATVLGFVAAGLIGGLVGGGYRAVRHVAAIPPPPAKPTMGMEAGGLQPIIIWVVDLAMGAAGGVVLGALIGAVWAIVRPRS